jgi:hypothetical protein
MAEGYLPFEDVLIFATRGDRRIGAGNVEEVAEFGEKELVVGAFGCAGVLPSLDEDVCGHEWRGRVKSQVYRVRFRASDLIPLGSHRQLQFDPIIRCVCQILLSAEVTLSCLY